MSRLLPGSPCGPDPRGWGQERNWIWCHSRDQIRRHLCLGTQSPEQGWQQMHLKLSPKRWGAGRWRKCQGVPAGSLRPTPTWLHRLLVLCKALALLSPLLPVTLVPDRVPSDSALCSQESRRQHPSHCVALCPFVWRCVTLYPVVWHCVALYPVVWRCVALYYTVSCCNTLYCT